jgi:hypothetical protein
MAKNASGAAFLNSKKRAEEMALAQESGMDIGESFRDQDRFNMQHHHLLNCLENTTVCLLFVIFISCIKVKQIFPYICKVIKVWSSEQPLANSK